MKMKKMAALLSAVMLGVNVALPIPVALASEVDTVLSEQLIENTEDLSYESIQYDGTVQTISLAENLELQLLNWKDELKEVIVATVTSKNAEGTLSTKEIELKIQDKEVVEYKIDGDQTIHLAIEEAVTFETKTNTPEFTVEEFVSIEQNENDTSKEQAVILDDQGIILKREERYQFIKIVENERAIITEEEYISINNTEEETEEIIEEVEDEIEEPNEDQEIDVEKEEADPEKTETSVIEEDKVDTEVQEETTINSSMAILESARAIPNAPNVVYSTHIEKYGWSLDAENGEYSGTQGEAKRLESIKIQIKGIKNLGIAYSTHIEKKGWTNFVADGQMSGTVGEAKRLEAVKVQLTGTQAKNYDVYYRVHAQSYGWLGWTKNGEPSGTEGHAKRLEAIEIMIVEKGSNAPGSTTNSFVKGDAAKPSTPAKDLELSYSSFVNGLGWQKPVTNGAFTGTEGVKKSLEAIRIGIENVSGLNVRYSSHMQGYGWMDWVNGAGISGLPSQNKRLEAVKIELTGVNAKKYDIYYRVHVEKFGWLGWAKNGQSAGSEGYGYHAEALEVKVVAKNSSFNRGGAAFKMKDSASIIYSTHIEKVGWSADSKDGKMSGTQERSLRMEALKVSLKTNQYSGGVTYKTHVEKNGWMNEVSNGAISGTTGQAKRVEAIQLNLTGEMAQHYDIYYRSYAQTYGWLGWAKNGMSSGTEGMGKRLEGLEIKLVEKGLPAPAVIATKAFKKAEPAPKKKVIFLDPGHGGADGGTSHGGYDEKDINLQLSFIVKTDLEKAGYTVIMSRTSDIFIDHKVGRSEMANKSGADIFISLHQNSMPFNSNVNGIETFYYEYDPNWQPEINGAMHNDPTRVKESGNLAHSVQNSLISATGAYNRKVQRETFAVLRETAIPAILVEFGFMSNPTELNKLKTDSYQRLLSKALTNGVNTYFKNK
ncbi:N-acetylmuramoyl-L-alanine amidase [Jeotgalibaca sp. MA1X17-3]|uniref:N-acetylmuramoyl-L-alanine amidase n=1 Tax=Jeotgalibaca sp. MA1X17-3 TaxID=2908211 RepID=UPI001F417EAA|nr:N-acetylmuramoyl-L-alanine amidase [Jeotgalibaca sp. MA1X17-3]UJF15236.1 N-acetylmuramoyl-L-alanine amidase [Jeotgalibaca sp. MA1X17-3]